MGLVYPGRGAHGTSRAALRRCAGSARSDTPQRHVHRVLVRVTVDQVVRRHRDDAVEDRLQQTFEGGVAFRRPVHRRASAPERAMRAAHAGFAVQAGVLRAHQPFGPVVGVQRDDVPGAGTPGAWDVIALDTDNGPEWLVRAENAGLYGEAGVRSAHGALRRGGAAVYWSPERYPAFERLLEAVFDRVVPVTAHDLVDGHPHEYTMYVALRGV